MIQKGYIDRLEVKVILEERLHRVKVMVSRFAVYIRGRKVKYNR